jgi:hypothetical protein
VRAALPNDRIAGKAPEKDREVRCQTAPRIVDESYRRINSVRPFENLIPFQNIAGPAKARLPEAPNGPMQPHAPYFREGGSGTSVVCL